MHWRRLVLWHKIYGYALSEYSRRQNFCHHLSLCCSRFGNTSNKIQTDFGSCSILLWVKFSQIKIICRKPFGTYYEFILSLFATVNVVFLVADFLFVIADISLPILRHCLYLRFNSSMSSSNVPIFTLDETKQTIDDNVSGSVSGSFSGNPNSVHDAAFTKQCQKDTEKALSCRKRHFTDDFRLQLILLLCVVALLVIWAALYFPLTKNFQ